MPKLPKPKSYASNYWLFKVKAEFCQGTGFETPELVVKHGIKTPRDWCDVLDKHRTPYIAEKMSRIGKGMPLGAHQ